jgi:hypothetical protein
VNKSVLRKRLRDVLVAVQNEPIAAEIDRLCDAVAVLDVCTPGEREWLEASLSSESLRKLVAEFPGSALAQARDKAIAERTPPDPVETFIAEVRAAHNDKYLTLEEVYQTEARALARLDAARGRK